MSIAAFMERLFLIKKGGYPNRTDIASFPEMRKRDLPIQLFPAAPQRPVKGNGGGEFFQMVVDIAKLSCQKALPGI